MEYILLVVSGIVIGFMVAAPIGPVNLICIRRTLSFGPVNGLVAGVGAALGDGIFATVTAFGMTAVSEVIRGHTTLLQIFGGVLLMFFGISTYISDPLHGRGVEKAAARPVSGGSLVRTFASTFALTITNPVTLFGFAALFAGLTGIARTHATFVNAGLLVCGGLDGVVVHIDDGRRFPARAHRCPRDAHHQSRLGHRRCVFRHRCVVEAAGRAVCLTAISITL
jgi:threonine/homoserine/homoserine lactone efflux protein